MQWEGGRHAVIRSIQLMASSSSIDQPSADGCLIHADKDECLRDSFCVWSSKAELCIQRNGNILRNYEAPKLFFPVQDRFDEYNSHASMYDAIQNRYAGRAVKNYQGNTMLLTECNVVIEEPAFPIQFTMERMFYHFSTANATAQCQCEQQHMTLGFSRYATISMLAVNDNLSRLLNSIQEVMNPNPYERSSMSNHVVIAQVCGTRFQCGLLGLASVLTHQLRADLVL